MDNLEPITRNEMFLNGDDLEPITREEMILAGADLEPLTRHEWFLKKYRGSGDVTIKQLAVTENGTYSESGKAYSPVVVNVPAPPIPENAYLLNDLSGLPANIASFTDGTDLPMASLKVAVTPYQDLSHGDPSPSNICPISGWSEANLGVVGKNLIPYIELGMLSQTDGSEESNTDNKRTGFIRALPNNQYTISGLDGSSISIRIFEFKKDKSYIRNYVSSNITNSVTIQTGAEVGYIRFQGNKQIFTSNVTQCEKGTTATTYSPYNGTTYTIDLNGTRYGGEVDATDGTFLDMIDHIASYNGEELPPAWISDRDVYAVGTTPTIGAEVVYPRATPITVQLAPTPVKSLEGENNISANCGQITEVKYFKRA